MNETEAQIEIMRAARIKDDEIVRLAQLKKRVDHGEVNETTTLEYKY